MQDAFNGLDLRGLQLFAAVVETRSMTLAAERLAITQSAVSQGIQKLEAGFDIVLIDRSVRPLAVTTKGRLLYDRGQWLLASAKELHASIHAPVGHALPRLRCGFVHSVAATIGPRLIDAHVDLADTWSVRSGLTARHEQALLAREVDLLVVEGALEDIESLERHHVLREPLVVAVPRHFQTAISKLDDVASRLRLVRYSPESMTGRLVAGALRRHRIDAVGGIEFDSTDTLLAMVAAGDYWTLTTPLCALQCAHLATSLRFCALPGELVSRTLTLVTRQYEYGGLATQLAETARDILVRECAPMAHRLMPWLGTHFAVGAG